MRYLISVLTACAVGALARGHLPHNPHPRARRSSARRSSTATAARRCRRGGGGRRRAHRAGRPARRRARFPRAPQQVDARGRWIVPGFIDTNVHLSLYGGQNDRYESLVRYQPRQDEIVLEAAQIDLSYGITTVRDSYGALAAADARVRDRIARGEEVGARILAAGNILGWSGPYSFSFSRVTAPLTLFQEQMNDYIAQGGGEELMAMSPAGAARGHRRLHRQAARLPQVRRHEPFLRADLHRLLARGAEGDRRRRPRAQPVRRDALDQRRGAARVDRRRHRRHPASGDPRRPRAARRSRRGDSSIAGSSARCWSARSPAGWKRHLKTKEENEKKKAEAEKERPHAGAREDHRGAAQGSGRCGRRSRDAAAQRADADSFRLPCDAGHRQLLGRGAGTDAHAEAARSGSRHRHDSRDRRARRARA